MCRWRTRADGQPHGELARMPQPPSSPRIGTCPALVPSNVLPPTPAPQPQPPNPTSTLTHCGPHQVYLIVGWGDFLDVASQPEDARAENLDLFLRMFVATGVVAGVCAWIYTSLFLNGSNPGRQLRI